MLIIIAVGLSVTVRSCSRMASPCPDTLVSTMTTPPSAVVQVSAYFGAQLSAFVGQHVQRLLQSRLGAEDRQAMFSVPDTMGELPATLADARDRVVAMCREGRLDDALQRTWLAHLIADGFSAVPAPTDPPWICLSRLSCGRRVRSPGGETQAAACSSPPMDTYAPLTTQRRWARC